MTLRISTLKNAHKQWFSEDNMRLSGDIEYRILHNKQHQPYLVRLTEAFTDMFGGARTAHYRINPIGDNLEILSLDDRIFTCLREVKQALAKS